MKLSTLLHLNVEILFCCDRIALITPLAITATCASRDTKERPPEVPRTIARTETQDPNHADAMKQVRAALRALTADANAKETSRARNVIGAGHRHTDCARRTLMDASSVTAAG